jgi:hypothetical protein
VGLYRFWLIRGYLAETAWLAYARWPNRRWASVTAIESHLHLACTSTSPAGRGIAESSVFGRLSPAVNDRDQHLANGIDEDNRDVRSMDCGFLMR